MPNAIVRNVLASLILVVLCFVIGAQAAENSKMSVGIIVALVGVVFMLWLGSRCWVLIYLLPPVVSLMPVPGKIGELPLPFLVGIPVLGYWMLMSVMGYTRFRWRGLWLLDIPLLVFFIYFAATFVRHPVSMAMFGWDTEYVGGREYAWCICAYIYYVAISIIPCQYEQVLKVLRWGIVLSVGVAVLAVLLQLVGIRGGVDITELRDAATTKRFTMFTQLGVYGIIYIYGLFSLQSILVSPGKLLGCLISFGAILISGWRESLMANGFVIMALGIVKRELWCLACLGCLVYVCLFYLGSEGVLREFPFGMQRTLSAVPGIEVSEEVAAEADGSSDWRIVMWKWALDPRTGYIKDYMWGDGFGRSVDLMRRETTALMRGSTRYGEQEFFAEQGVWHSGVISSIHRVGYVGLGLVTVIYLVGTYLMFRVCMSVKGTPLYFPALFYLIPYAAAPSLFYISEGTFMKFFATYIQLVLAKLIFCVAREQKILIPVMERKRYVPQMIREHEEQIRPAM